LAGALVFGAAFVKASESCATCQNRITGNIYVGVDTCRKTNVLVCEPCLQITTRCVVCTVRVHKKFGLHLPDGRAYCARDAKSAVMEETVAFDLFAKAKEQAVDLLSRYPPLPLRNLEVHLVTQEEFVAQYRRLPSIDDPLHLFGLTITRPNKDGAKQHDIYLLHGVPRDEFLAVCAHEYTHAWLQDREKPVRQLHKDTREGICELIAYQVVTQLRLEEEKQRILENPYTVGQIRALVAAEKEYGLHRLIQWVDRGIDSWVDTNQLDAVLNLREAETREGAVFQWPLPVVSPPALDKLVLKSLALGGRQPLALINNVTLAVGEEAKVRVGTSNVLVRCLAISNAVVTVQVQGDPKPIELRLPAK
jgi:hypothetical protein